MEIDVIYVLSRMLRRKRRRRLIDSIDMVKSRRQAARRLSLIFALHVSLMVWLESMDYWTAVWYTLTAATTVGFGDVSPASWQGFATAHQFIDK